MNTIVEGDGEVTESIPKGTVLQEWKPYKVVSLVDKGRDFGLAELPGYVHCPVLNLSDDVRLKNEGTPDLERFRNQLFRDGSFQALCILALFDELLSGKTFPVLDVLPSREEYDDESSASGSDLEDPTYLLMQSWPFVQARVSWKQFLSLYRCIESSMHMVTIEHPLVHYAKHTIFRTQKFDEAVKIAVKKKLIPKQSKNRLQVSQFLLDFVASVPPRFVGILLDNPFSSNPPKTTLKQSSCPSAFLELSVESLNNQMKCRMISIYDLDVEEPMTVSTRGSFAQQNNDELGDNLQINARGTALMTQRLAHNYFQDDNYKEALRLYKKCFEFFSENDEAKAADLLHSMAAVRLSELKFLEAQREWKKGSKFRKIHPGIALQLEKQSAYGYFDMLHDQSNQREVLPYEAIGSSRKLFVTPNAVSPDTCATLIEWAKQHASENGGWTTSRHYAVPTNDIPLHVSENLLSWFVAWFRETGTPLLQSQFQTEQTFFVHDAFLVRYSAGSSSDYLPLHFDESTHSLVLALNSEFEGGGTYFYSLDHTSVPTCGTLVSFRGNQLLHGGNVVTKGERFIIAAFLYVDDEAPQMQKRSLSAQVFKRDSKRQKERDEGFSFGFF